MEYLPRLLSACGLPFMVLVAWLLSTDRRRFPFRIVFVGVGLQLSFGLFVLKTPVGLALFAFLNRVVAKLLSFTEEGSRFLFGAYLDEHYTVALSVLPTIIFFSSLMSVLYHVGVMQRLVVAVAWVMRRTMKTTGPETLSAAANIFVGMTEAPLLVRPFVQTMTRSELMAVMTAGFATVAGGVLAAYVGMLQASFPDIAGHLIAASVMSAPAALVVAKVMLPERESARVVSSDLLAAPSKHVNIVDAAAGGATEGVKLAINVGAMLLAFLALVAMVNFVFALPAYLHNQAVWAEVSAKLLAQGGAVPEGCAAADSAAKLAECIRSAGLPNVGAPWDPWTMQRLLGVLFWPFALLMGVPWADCTLVASLLGEKMILNEFVAFARLAGEVETLSERGTVIASYALCGFANLGSIGVQLGGIGAMAPSRRGELARIGPRAMVAGTLAAFMTACVAGLLVE